MIVVLQNFGKNFCCLWIVGIGGNSARKQGGKQVGAAEIIYKLQNVFQTAFAVSCVLLKIWALEIRILKIKVLKI